MSRVAICLGVNKPGLLTPLRAAASSAEQFGAWLKTKQKFDEVEVLTDDAGPPTKSVTAKAVKKVVKRLVEMGPRQLVVYFSGHGVLNGGSEIWLLSEASEDPDEAIDLTASREAARTSRVPNVVFISDACRALPTNLPTSSLRGASIFPLATSLPAKEAETDIFYAASKTGVALEVPVNPDDRDNGPYKSLFTDVLLRSYVNPPPAITLKFTPDGEPESIVVVPNRKLRPLLVERVIDEAETHFPGRAPAPVIRLESGDESFIGRAEFSDAANSGGVLESIPLGRVLESIPLGGVLESTHEMQHDEGTGSPTRRKAKQAMGLTDRLLQELKDADVKTAFESQKAIDGGTDGFETRTGIELTGAKPQFAVPTSGDLAPSTAGSDGRTRWHFSDISGEAPSIAVGFDGGGAVVTCLPDFVTSIAVEDGRVVNISFIPARNSERWKNYQHVAERVNALRAKVAAAARFGQLDIEPEEALEFAETIRVYKGYDPTLGLYAAYAYAEIGASPSIKSVQDYIVGDLGVTLYDIAMLADRREPKKRGPKIVPFCPMLSQGWSYALAYGIRWPKVIKDAARRPSLWTTFDSDSIEKIAKAIERGELK